METWVTGVVSVVVTSLLWRIGISIKNRKARKAARAVIQTYLKDVENGLKMLNVAASNPVTMPKSGWLRYPLSTDMICAVLECENDSASWTGFPIKDFLYHLKNYFDILCLNVEGYSKQPGGAPATVLLSAQQAAQGIIEMLKRIDSKLA